MTAKTHIFENDVTWKEDKNGILNFEGNHEILFSTPASFGGPIGLLSPEDLFVASVNACTLTSFLYFAEKLDLKLISYTCNAKGSVIKTEGPYLFSEITLNLAVVVERDEEKIKAIKAIELAEKYCIISKSIANTVEVKINPKVMVKS